MLISVYFAIALLAFSDAIQPHYGPQTFSQPPAPSQKEYRFYLTPDAVKSFQNAESSENLEDFSQKSLSQSGTQQISFQNYAEDQQKQITQNTEPAAVQEPKGEFRGLLSPSLVYSNGEQSSNFDFKHFTVLNSGEEQQQQLKSPNTQEPRGEFRGLLSSSSLYSKGEQNNNYNIKILNSIRNSADEQQHQLINQYTKSSNVQEPQAELRGFLAPSSGDYEEGSNIQGQENNYDFNNFYQQTKQKAVGNSQGDQIIEIKKESQVPQQYQWKPYNPNSVQTQEEALLHEELQQHWNRILDHNRAQLKTFSTVSSENTKAKEVNDEAQEEQTQSNSQTQAQKTEKEIENIMKNILSNSVNIEQKTETEKQLEYIILKNLQKNNPKNNQNTGAENQLQSMLKNLKETSIKNNRNAETQKQMENILKNIQSIAIQNSMNIEALKQMDNILKEIQANSVQNNQNSEIEKQNKYVENNVQSSSPKNNQNIAIEKQILKNAQSNNQQKNINAEFEKQKEILLKNAQKSSLKNQKSNVEEQIENILKQDELFEREKEKALAQARAANERPPIIIHKEVSITKHLPVYKHIKVAVPTPVLVPVPEPYEVKVPHVYPVPLELVKHIPVPVVRKH